MRRRIPLLLVVPALIASSLALGAPALAAPGDTVTASALLERLTVSSAAPAGYDRDLFEHWVDADGNGCDTRREVLIAESAVPVVRPYDCTITSGEWRSWYDDVTWTAPADVDIDHMVPLAEAWRSGASAWTPQQRRAYANDLGFADSLVAVTDSVNQSKGDRDPAQWMPPTSSAAGQCRYVTAWVSVKVRWGLSVDPAEKSALQATISSTCGATTTTSPGIAIAAAAVVDTSAQTTVYRFWSPQNQTHFYTTNVSERNQIISSYPTNIWTYEGPRYQAFSSQQPGTVPLFRFWSPKLSGHFFTANESEKNAVIANYPASTWTYEGIAYYVFPSTSSAVDTVPVARFWSPTNQHHFYTASAQEAAVVKTYPVSIWTYEGINYKVPVSISLVIPPTPAQYVTPAPAPVPTPTSVYYRNCDAVRAAGKAPLYAGQPGYETPRLDRDGDGVACE